jgi:hypothetical protein
LQGGGLENKADEDDDAAGAERLQRVEDERGQRRGMNTVPGVALEDELQGVGDRDVRANKESSRHG